MCLYTGVSLQPAVQTTSSRLYSHQTSTIPVSSERSSLTLSFFCFLDFFYRWKIRWWLCPELTTISCSNLCGMRAELCCFSLWGAWGRVRVGTPRRRRGRRREGGRRASITLCTAVMPVYSPWHLQGHALTSAGISPPLYSHSCVSPPLWGNRTKFLVHYKSFREAPVDAWPRLDCHDCCSAALPSRGAGSDSLHGSRDCRGCLIKYMLPGKMKSSCSLLVLKMKGPPLQAVLRQSSIM